MSLLSAERRLLVAAVGGALVGAAAALAAAPALFRWQLWRRARRRFAAARRRRPKVFASGCFDLLHSGHIAFFKEAAALGELYVSVGNDDNVAALKARPMFDQRERAYMVNAIRYVHTAFVARGMGHDQSADLDAVRPDIFFVNEDGDRPSKRAQCEERGIEYVVSGSERTHAHARAHTHARTHTHKHARSRARTHARTQVRKREPDGGLLPRSSTAIKAALLPRG